MTLLIDTGAVEAQDRVEFWATASCDAYHPLQIKAVGRDPFHARMWRYSLAAMDVFRVAASPNTMTRSQRDIAAGSDDTLHFQIVLRGHLHTTQQGRSSTLGPGDMAVYDTAHPVLMHADEDFDVIALKLPREILGREFTTKISRLTAVRIPGKAGLPRLTARFVCGTAAGLADGSIAHEDADLAEHVIDLVRRLYVDLDVTPTFHPRSRRDLFLQAKAYIQAHLGDAALNPEQVASACFVSTRYVHRVFAGEGHTVSDWIRRERLDHCRRDLLDPALAHHSISSIATRWGLPSAPHFSRLFRRAYGESPREYRHRAAGEAG